MALSYTTHQKFPLLDTGGNNWGAIINAALTAMDAGREITLEAGENISQYDAVYVKSDGKIYKAKADSASTMPAIGICPYAITSGNDGKIRVVGWIQNAGWAWTIGAKLYLSNSTAGGLTETAPALPQSVGVAITANTIIIDPQREAERGDIIAVNHEIIVAGDNGEHVIYSPGDRS
jgi:hypothetical protein